MFTAQTQANDWRERIGIILVFCLLLAGHGWGVSRGWNSLNLPGHEFRQTQTALAAFSIQRDHNFSIRYPTPVLGKPWAVPMEFPLYQWAVVGLSNSTAITLTQAARSVSLACFYLMLPALFMLLGQLGVAPFRRLIVMGFVLCSPLYIFYSRAFLIETMALMWAMWFLLAFARAFERRSLGWLAAANLFGVVAGLVKVTTFGLFLLPAVLWTARGFWQDWRLDKAIRRRGASRTAGWSLAAVLLPVLVTVFWTKYADHIKSQNISAVFLMSNNVTEFSFGTFANRFSTDTLTSHWQNLTRNLVNPWVLGLAVVSAFLFSRRWWRQIGASAFCFVAALVVFPTLYAWHDYYAVAGGIFVVVAVGLSLSGLLQPILSRWIAWPVIGLLYVAQFWSYGQTYYPMQKEFSPGGSGLTQAIKRISDPAAVIVVAGLDWNSIIPYYSERRALMIRSHMEHDWTYLHEAFGNLKGEPVTIYVARGEQRENRTLLGLLEQYFDIDPRPVASWLDTEIYVHKNRRLVAIEVLRRSGNGDPGAAKLTLEAEAEDTSIVGREISFDPLLFEDSSTFAMISPKPYKFFAQFGVRFARFFDHPALFAHPDTRLWFRVPAGRHEVTVLCTIEPAAYAADIPSYDATDGVDFVIYRQRADGRRERVGSLFLDPRHNEADRGIRPLKQVVETEVGTDLVIATEPGPKNNAARDWAAIAGIDIRAITPSRLQEK